MTKKLTRAQRSAANKAAWAKMRATESTRSPKRKPRKAKKAKTTKKARAPLSRGAATALRWEKARAARKRKN